MPTPANLVHQTSTSTGTGNFTLSTVNGKQSFDTAFGHAATTNKFDYFISNQGAAEWEYGTGHMSDATTLVRDTVIESTNSNAAVSFSAGAKDITNDIPAAKQVSTDGTQTLTNKTLTSPAFTGPATLTSSALNRGLDSAQTGTGSYSATGRFAFNNISVSSDDIDMGLDGGKVDGLCVVHTFGGTAARGGRHAFETFGILTAATASDNPDRNYVAAAFTGQADVNDGGGSGTEKGAIFGFGAQGVLTANATYFLNLTAAEFNTVAQTGSSVKYKSIIQLAGRLDDAVSGSTYDGMLAISNQSGAVSWGNGILIGNMNGAHPIASTGSIIATTGSGTVTNGIDFSSYTISGNLIKGPGFSVSGDGSLLSMSKATCGLELGSQLSSNTPFIDFHSSANVVDYDSRLLASGGTSSAGNGALLFSGAGGFKPATSDAAALGSTSLMWSDLFLASGAVVNFNNGDVTVTHAANNLLFAGASSGYTFDAIVYPTTDDGAALGDTSHKFSDLFLASGGVLNWNSGNVSFTHSTNVLTFTGNNFIIAGLTFRASVDNTVTLGAASFGFKGAFLSSATALDWGNGNAKITHSTGLLTFNVPLKLPSYIVSGLPSAATMGAGARAFVTDATVTTFASTVVGGGSNGVPVYSDGTNWKIG